MKKPILMGLITLSCFLAKAQTVDTIPKIDGYYQLTDIIQLPKPIPKELLYNNAKMYFVDAYNSAKDVVQFDDKESGRIVGKGMLHINDSQFVAPWEWDVYYTTEILVKDGKYKYRIYDIHIKQYVGTARVEYDMTLDDAKRQTKKGTLKKMGLKMLNVAYAKFKETTDGIRFAMDKQESKTDF